MSGDICGDNRFEVIEKCKQKLIEATNIETSPDEMAVLDSILFRFWQMGWLPAAEPEKHTEECARTHACDCISRRAAIDAIMGLPTWWADEGGYYGGAQPPMEALLDPEDAVSAIENLPSAQPETIRCKDCKYWGKRGLCDKWDYYISNGDFYCGCAERRTDENNNE